MAVATRQFVTTITERGQVTLPAEIRRLFGLHPRDQVLFTVEGSAVRLAPVEYTLESAYGSVEPLNRPEDFEKLADAAKAEHVERAVRKLRKQ